MNAIRWIGILAAAASVSAFGCSSTPQGGSLSGDDGGGTTGDDSGGASSGAGSSSGAASGSGSGGASGGASGGSSGGGSSGGSGSSSGGSGGSSSSGSSSGMSMLGACSDAGALNNPEIDYGTPPVTLNMSSFSVPPGQEIYECQTFKNPWGKQVDIKDYTLNMGAGSHHMFAFYQSNATDGTIAACSQGGLTFAPYTFSAQSPQTEMTYPPTIGATIPQTTGFMLNVHYINTGSSALPASVALTMSIAKSGAVTNHAGAIFLNQASMSVASTCTTASGGCTSTAVYQLTQDVNIIVASSHMHKFATHFVANANQGAGVKIYETTQWSEPKPQIYCPALHLSSGTTIAWQCTDVNDTGSTLTFGEYANSNVMCISSNIFYPVMDVTNPVIGNPAGFGVCLSPDTPIATPEGDRPVASLQVGDIVMSMDHGKMRPVPLVRVSHTPVVNHHVVSVTLANGRVLHVSEGHPTAEGRLFRDLAPGDMLGDEKVVSVQSIAYDHDATYDIEPASDTATYVAGGALVGSTLRFPVR